MKKQVLFTIFVMVTLITSAQRAVIGPVSQDSVRSFYMTNWVGISLPATYTEHCIYQKVGDTVMSVTSTVSPPSMSYLATISNLVPSTPYRFASVNNVGGVYDTSAFETFTTPALQSLSIMNIITDTSVSPVKTRFHFDFGGGYSANVSVIVDGSLLNRTSSIRLTGSGDTAISMMGYSNYGTTYTSNFVYAVVVGNVPGISPDSFFMFANYTVPMPRKPLFVLGSGSVARSQDSLVFSASLLHGNAGPVTQKMILYDSTRLTSTTSTQIILSDSSFTGTYRNLATASGYSLTLIATNSAGADTLVIATHTLQVLAPHIVSVDTINASLTQTSIVVSSTTNGSWLNSTSQVYAKHVALGVPQIISGTSFIGTQTIQLGPFTNLNLNPTSNVIWVYITNGAGLVDSFQYMFTLLQLPTLTAPSLTNLLTQSQSQLEVVNILVNPPTGVPVNAYAFVNTNGTSYVDTVPLMNFQNVTAQAFGNDSISNLLGNTQYNVRLAVKDTFERWAVNPTVIAETTLAATQPICTISGVGYVQDSVTYLVNGSGNGYIIDLQNDLYSASDPNTALASLAPLILGPGNFGFTRFAFSEQGLVWGAEYEIRSGVDVHADKSDPFADSYYFKLTPLGIEQVDPFNSEEVMMLAYDMIGRPLLENSLPSAQVKTALKEKGFKGIAIIRPVSETTFKIIGGSKIPIID